MKILITDNAHVHYDRTGEITDKVGDDTWAVGIPNKDGSIRTTVKEGQFKVIKPLGKPSSGKVYRSDGLGCVEPVHPSELAWEERYG